MKIKKALIMGVVNITPDSFSDGGDYFSKENAFKHSVKLIEHGADILDIGGFTTFLPIKVSLQDEINRVVPLVRELVKEGITQISVDTKSAQVAQMVLDLGAKWINDQSAANDPNMPHQMIRAEKVVIMHSMDCRSGVHEGEKISYQNVVEEVKAFFQERISLLEAFGVKKENIILDPGIGFGKGLDDSLTLIKNIAEFNKLGCDTLLGLSRKSFLGKLLSIEAPKERDFATLGANIAAIQNGANVIRTHNVKALTDFLSAYNHTRNNDEDLH